MTCTACSRMNLSGGVRCSYCGVILPPAADFEIGQPESDETPTAATSNPAPAAGGAGIVGGIALLLVKGKSLLTLLKFGKLFTTLVTMFTFVWSYAFRFGWRLAFGLTVCILIHELGHVFVNWRKGLKQSAPVFIPFVGAVIFLKGFPNDPTVQSESGAGGPVAGGLAALACLGIYQLSHDPFWLVLAYLGFIMNLFNLIPIWQLDGSHIGSVFSPRTWDIVLILMLLIAIKVPSGLLWLILIAGFVLRLARHDDGRHYLATPAVRVRMAALYLVLCVGLSYGASQTMDFRSDAPAGVIAPLGTSGRPLASSANHSVRALNAGAPNERVVNLARWILRAAIFCLALGLWSLTSWLIYMAAGQRAGLRALKLPAAMIALLVAVIVAFYVIDAPPGLGWTYMGAYFAAAAAAVLYAGYSAARASSHAVRAPHGAYLARALAWAAGGSLLVSYAADNFGIALATSLCAAIVWLRHRWMFWGLLGSACQALNQPERAIQYLNRAIGQNSPADLALALRMEIANRQIGLGRGGPALEALDTNDIDLRNLPVSVQAQVLALRAIACAYLERFEETLACCERILTLPALDPKGMRQLSIVHLILAEAARSRRWPDEQRAQAEWCLRVLPRSEVQSIAAMRALRSEALLELKDIPEARSSVEEATKSAHDALSQARIAIVQARLAMSDGKPENARLRAEQAMRLSGAALDVEYWHAVVLTESSGDISGKDSLNKLASAWPEEHWGKMALRRLNSVQQPDEAVLAT